MTRKVTPRNEIQKEWAVAEHQRQEAWNLLSEAKKASIVLRESRETNHYRLALDRMFRGKKRHD